MIYQSLLLECIDVESHFHLAEPFSDGSHDFSKNSVFKEIMMVHCMYYVLHLRC